MEYFKKYVSNCLAGTGNQYWFATENANTVYIARSFYKVAAGGEYNYSFLYANVVDSTMTDFSESSSNTVCDPWKIHALRCAVCPCGIDMKADVLPGMQQVTFEGKTFKNVAPGEFFHTDALRLKAEAGEYICLEMEFSGTMIPCLRETLVPSFVKQNGAFVQTYCVPLTAMVGCERAVKEKIVFWGDSITQGLGTAMDAYQYWVAGIGKQLGNDVACWNLGLGCARAMDAATCGAWFYKARQADLVSVCLGTNDIINGYSAERVIGTLRAAVLRLKRYCRVGLFTVPPFGWEGEHLKVWHRVNDYIRNELANEVEYVFDTVPVWGMAGGEPQMPRYGGHPNAEGCAEMAKAFCEFYLNRKSDK